MRGSYLRAAAILGGLAILGGIGTAIYKGCHHDGLDAGMYYDSSSQRAFLVGEKTIEPDLNGDGKFGEPRRDGTIIMGQVVDGEPNTIAVVDPSPADLPEDVRRIRLNGVGEVVFIDTKTCPPENPYFGIQDQLYRLAHERENTLVRVRQKQIYEAMKK